MKPLEKVPNHLTHSDTAIPTTEPTTQGPFWIIRLSSLGDTIAVSSAVEWLWRFQPNTDVFFVTASQYAPLFERDPRIRQVLAFDRAEGVGGFYRFVTTTLRPKMRQVGGVILDFHNNTRSWMIRRLCALPTVVTVRKHTSKRFLVCTTKINLLKDRIPVATSIVSQLNTTLAPPGWSHPSLKNVRPTLRASSTLSTKAQGLLGTRVRGPFVGIAPGSRWPSKQWPPSHFIDLIHLIHQRTRYHCIVFGGRDDRACRSIAKETGSIDMSGKLTLPELMDAMHHCCSAVVANDTGLMHMGDALGIPTCGIFGPTGREIGYLPLNPHSVSIGIPMWCRPCLAHKGQAPCVRFRKHACLKNISPQMVFETCAKRWSWKCLK